MGNDLVDIVNERNEIIGQASEDEASASGAITRNVVVFVQDENGKYVLGKRAMHKKVAPGQIDAAICGRVRIGESYADAAARERDEEVGQDFPLRQLCVFYQEFPWGERIMRHWTAVFYGKANGPLRWNHEATEHARLSHNELRESMRMHPEQYCQGFRQEFKMLEQQLPQ